MLANPDFQQAVDRLSSFTQGQKLDIASVHRDMQTVINLAFSDSGLTAYLLAQLADGTVTSESSLNYVLAKITQQESTTEIPEQKLDEDAMITQLIVQLSILSAFGLNKLKTIQRSIEEKIEAKTAAKIDKEVNGKVEELVAAFESQLNLLPKVNERLASTQKSIFVQHLINSAIELACPGDTSVYATVSELAGEDEKFVFAVSVEVSVVGGNKTITEKLYLEEDLRNMHILEPEYLLTFVLKLLKKMNPAETGWVS